MNYVAYPRLDGGVNIVIPANADGLQAASHHELMCRVRPEGKETFAMWKRRQCCYEYPIEGGESLVDYGLRIDGLLPTFDPGISDLSDESINAYATEKWLQRFTVAHENLPPRRWRDAHAVSGGKVVVDLTRAAKLRKTELSRELAQWLKDNGAAYMASLADGDAQAQNKLKGHRARAKTLDLDKEVGKAKSLADLEAISVPGLVEG